MIHTLSLSVVQVEGSAVHPYVCFGQYCSCPAFHNHTILRREAICVLRTATSIFVFVGIRFAVCSFCRLCCVACVCSVQAFVGVRSPLLSLHLGTHTFQFRVSCAVMGSAKLGMALGKVKTVHISEDQFLQKIGVSLPPPPSSSSAANTADMMTTHDISAASSPAVPSTSSSSSSSAYRPVTYGMLHIYLHRCCRCCN